MYYFLFSGSQIIYLRSQQFIHLGFYQNTCPIITANTDEFCKILPCVIVNQ